MIKHRLMSFELSHHIQIIQGDKAWHLKFIRQSSAMTRPMTDTSHKT